MSSPNDIAIKEFFEGLGADYVDYRPVPSATTRTEVDFYSTLLPIELLAQPSRSYLDVCCGYGRHALEFARRGWRVTAIDSAASLLEEGRQRARLEELDVSFVQAEMDAVDRVGEFDVVSILGTSFGFYPTDTRNADVVHRLARSLRPDGWFILEAYNPDYEAARISKSPSESHTPRKGTISKHEVFISNPRAKQVQLTYQTEEKTFSLNCTLRLYSKEELEKMANASGLRLVNVYGDQAGTPYSALSRRMICVFRRVPTARQANGAES